MVGSYRALLRMDKSIYWMVLRPPAVRCLSRATLVPFGQWLQSSAMLEFECLSLLCYSHATLALVGIHHGSNISRQSTRPVKSLVLLLSSASHRVQVTKKERKKKEKRKQHRLERQSDRKKSFKSRPWAWTMDLEYGQ